MRLSDAYTSKAIAIRNTEVGSNKIGYLGAGLFPSKKKMGLDLKWIRTSKGLPVSLAPSAFDTVSTIRSREGIKIDETEMAFFKESMLVKEADEQEILRVKDASDPYAQDVLDRIFDDANTLIDGADVVPERMRMQLLSSNGGHPSISISVVGGATYAYNYDPNNEYSATNYMDVSTDDDDKWSAVATADPMGDIATALDSVEAVSGTRPNALIVSRLTMNYIKQNAKVKSAILAQNATAVIEVTDANVASIVKARTGLTIVIYDKMYIDEQGNEQYFYPDNKVTLLPEGALGKTWFGTTPEERTARQVADVDVAMYGKGIAVATKTEYGPPALTSVTVSEIVLPSYEGMDSTFVLEVK